MQYYIENGVRRAVAAREAGVKSLRGIVYESGKPPVLITIAIDDLHSPKTSVSLSDPRFVRALQGMLAAQGSSGIPPIEVQPLGDPGQKRTVPLSQVSLDP